MTTRMLINAAREEQLRVAIVDGTELKDYHVEITDKALKLLGAMDQPVMDLHHRLIGHLNRTELKELIRLLEKARAPLSDASATG